MIDGISRLFAYPKVPHFKNHGERVILDSGAFGIYSHNGVMTENYKKKLSSHYEKFDREEVMCVAPDILGNPTMTMRNYDNWIKSGKHSRICPVIQPSGTKMLNVNEMKYQIDYYVKRYNTKRIFVSNFFSGDVAIAQGMAEICDYAKSVGIEWIHIFGAGWSLRDISIWSTIRTIDSMDSIAYYSTREASAFGGKDPIENIERITKCVQELNTYQKMQ